MHITLVCKLAIAIEGLESALACFASVIFRIENVFFLPPSVAFFRHGLLNVSCLTVQKSLTLVIDCIPIRVPMLNLLANGVPIRASISFRSDYLESRLDFIAENRQSVSLAITGRPSSFAFSVPKIHLLDSGFLDMTQMNMRLSKPQNMPKLHPSRYL